MFQELKFPRAIHFNTFSAFSFFTWTENQKCPSLICFTKTGELVTGGLLLWVDAVQHKIVSIHNCAIFNLVLADFSLSSQTNKKFIDQNQNDDLIKPLIDDLKPSLTGNHSVLYKAMKFWKIWVLSYVCCISYFPTISPNSTLLLLLYFCSHIIDMLRNYCTLGFFDPGLWSLINFYFTFRTSVPVGTELSSPKYFLTLSGRMVCNLINWQANRLHTDYPTSRRQPDEVKSI